MSGISPTYAFENGQVFAIAEGRVIASGTDVDKVKEDAEEKLEREEEKKRDKKITDKKRSATHVETPNGLRGQIVSRVSSWDAGDTVSVRFENGRIVNLATSKLPVEAFVTEDVQKTASATPITSLRDRLDADFDHDKEALAARKEELGAIHQEASQLLSKRASFTDEQALHEIVVLADAERSEVAEALEHLEQADTEIFAPFEPQVVEQAQVGTHGIGGTWLDQTTQDMAAEAEGQDFEKILDEGPVEFVAELPDAALADTGVAASAARDYIVSKTAGVQSDEIEKYRDVFVERVEDARRSELSARKEVARKQASVDEPAATEGPDEGLFL